MAARGPYRWARPSPRRGLSSSVTANDHASSDSEAPSSEPQAFSSVHTSRNLNAPAGSSYAHRGRGPDAGRPRGSNWDTTKLLAANGRLGACPPLPLSGLTLAAESDLAESESTSPVGTRKFRHVPPGPPVPVGILLPPMDSMGHRRRLGPQLLPRPSPRRNGDRAPKGDTDFFQVGQSVHMPKMVPKRMEIKGQRRESLNSPCSLPWQPSRPWSSCPSSRSWPWPTLRTRLVRLVGQSHRRPARPTLTVHRGYAAPAARNAEASVHA